MPTPEETALAWSAYLQIRFRVHKEQLTLTAADVTVLLAKAGVLQEDAK